MERSSGVMCECGILAWGYLDHARPFYPIEVPLLFCAPYLAFRIRIQEPFFMKGFFDRITTRC